MEDRKFTINIRIDGKGYSLTISRKDEEKYRIAAKKVDETVKKFREQFGDQDSKDILAMTAFQIALNNTNTQAIEDKTRFIEELRNINDDISDFLKEKKKR